MSDELFLAHDPLHLIKRDLITRPIRKVSLQRGDSCAAIIAAFSSVPPFLGIPGESERDSGMMLNANPGSFRTVIRYEGEHRIGDKAEQL
jgi:hypothetical protein